MKIDSENLADHQVKLSVEIEAKTLLDAKRRAARKISRTTKIPGFRPGKAPFQVVQRHVGEVHLLEEALDILIDELYPQVIDQSGIQPYGPGRLEDFSQTDPPVFEFLVPLAPEVELGEYQSIRIPYEIEEITDEDIERVLHQVQENQAIIEPVERAAEEGDIVYLTVSATRDDTEGEPDADALLVPERHLNLLIRPETAETDTESEEWPFPGFSRHLIGLEAGDTRTISHQFGEDTPDDDLKGAPAIFAIDIREIRSRDLPELSDELAQSVGDYDTLDALKDYIRETLTNNERRRVDAAYAEQILEQVIERTTFKYPPQMLDAEIEVLLDQLNDRLASNNLDLDIYLKTREMDLEGLKAELQPEAEGRIQRGLVLYEIAEVENLEVSQNDVQEEVSRTIDQVYRILPEREARKQLSVAAVQNLISQVTSDQLADLALARLRAIARGEIDQPAADDSESQAAEDAAPPEASESPAAQETESPGPAEAEPAAEAPVSGEAEEAVTETETP